MWNVFLLALSTPKTRRRKYGFIIPCLLADAHALDAVAISCFCQRVDAFRRAQYAQLNAQPSHRLH